MNVTILQFKNTQLQVQVLYSKLYMSKGIQVFAVTHSYSIKIKSSLYVSQPIFKELIIESSKSRKMNKYFLFFFTCIEYNNLQTHVIILSSNMTKKEEKLLKFRSSLVSFVVEQFTHISLF